MVCKEDSDCEMVYSPEIPMIMWFVFFGCPRKEKQQLAMLRNCFGYGFLFLLFVLLFIWERLLLKPSNGLNGLNSLWLVTVSYGYSTLLDYVVMHQISCSFLPAPEICKS